ncbi:hypothetical protein ACYSNW_11965 [Enterococcus sp. LJL99]
MNLDYENEPIDPFLNELSLIFESEELRWEMNYRETYDYTKTTYLDSYIDSMNE